MRVLVKAVFDPTSGYGNDGIGMVQALQHMEGVEVALYPTGVNPPLPREVAEALMNDYSPPFDITLVHLDPLRLVVEPGLRLLSEKTIAWTMWEWETFKPRGYSKVRKQLKGFDALVSYDEVSHKALDPFLTKNTEHHILQGGYWSEDWPYAKDRDWDAPFRFIMMGQLHRRKNPFVAVRAFDRLKQMHGDDFNAELHMKTNIKGLHPAMEERYEGLRIFYQFWNHDQMYRFYSRAHCLLAQPRGEGKNMPALESMTTGIPVIATNFGGHTHWMSDEYAYPLNFTRVQEQGMGVAAEADEDHLVELMWHVYTNRDEAKHKGEIASRVIPSMCDWKPVMAKMLAYSQTLGGRPFRDPIEAGV